MCLLIYSVLSMSAVFAKAQISDTVYNNGINNYNAGDMEILTGQSPVSIGARMIDLGDEGIQGSSYFSDNFQPAQLKLVSSDSIVSSKALVKLDFHQHEVLIQLKNSGQALVLNDSKIYRIQLEVCGQLFRVFRAAELEDRGAAFTIAEVLQEGPISLVKVGIKNLLRSITGRPTVIQVCAMMSL